jgi:hypothetical protein
LTTAHVSHPQSGAPSSSWTGRGVERMHEVEEPAPNRNMPKLAGSRKRSQHGFENALEPSDAAASGGRSTQLFGIEQPFGTLIWALTRRTLLTSRQACWSLSPFCFITTIMGLSLSLSRFFFFPSSVVRRPGSWLLVPWPPSCLLPSTRKLSRPHLQSCSMRALP